MIHEIFRRVAREFPTAHEAPFEKHPLADFLRKEAGQEIQDTIARPDPRAVGAPGKGNWAEIPWIGIFNPEVTVSATEGYYVVYLFAADMSAVNLCLAQGVTAVRAEFKDKAVDEMVRRAALMRDRVPEFSQRFGAGPIALGGSTPLARDYDTAVAFFKKYDLGDLVEEGTLIADLNAMMHLYDLVVSRGGVDNIEGALELGADQDETSAYQTIEERRRYVRHSRIERHSISAKLAKKVHGYICQACGFNFVKVYGELGEEFIEAHHLIPLASLPEGQPVAMDPKTDFAVLCANCHRMVHRKKEPLSIDAVGSLSGVAGLRNWFK